MIDQRDIDKILRQIIKQGDCWFLPVDHCGGVQPYLYRGVAIRVDGQWRAMGAHKAMCIVRHGPIPKGMVVRHLCGYGGCCNPDHVVPGTRSDNMLDVSFHAKYGHGALAPEKYS